MDDKEFEALKATIQRKMLELEKLQLKYIRETGGRFVISGPVKDMEQMEVSKWNARA